VTAEQTRKLVVLSAIWIALLLAPYWMALAWTGLADHDKAMTFLNEAYRIRSSNLASIQSDPLFDPMRADPRFLELLQKMGLPASSVKPSASE